MPPMMIIETLEELTATFFQRNGIFVRLDRVHRAMLVQALSGVSDELKIECFLLKSKNVAERRQLAAAFSWKRSMGMITNLHARVFTSYLELCRRYKQPTDDMLALSRYLFDLVVALAQQGAIGVADGGNANPRGSLTKKPSLRAVA